MSDEQSASSSRERAVSEHEKQLRDSEARHRAIFESAVDGIITIDDSGTIESVNPAAEKLFGYSAVELVGRNVETLMPTPYFEQHRDYLQNYLRTGEKKIIGVGREVVGLRKDGATFPMDLAVSELSIAGKRMFTGLIHDLTERKEAEKERERLLAREAPLAPKPSATAKPRMIFWQRSVTSFAHRSLPRC